MRNCVSTFEIRSYATGEFSEKEASEFEHHVRTCAACREAVRSFLHVGAALAAGTQKPLHACLSTDAILELAESEDLRGRPETMDHLSSCAECRARFATAREELDSPLPEAPQSCLNRAMTAVSDLHASDRTMTVPSKRTSPIPWLAAAASLLLLLGAFFAAMRLYDRGWGRGVMCVGTVTVQQADGSTGGMAVGDKVGFGRKISTSAGAVCQIQYPGGLLVSLREQSRFGLVGKGRFELEQGTVHVSTGERGEIEGRTSEGSVTASNASFALSAYEGKTLLQVIEGQVFFRNSRGGQRVGPLQECVATGDQAPELPCPTKLVHIWRPENPCPKPVFKWDVLDRFESLNGWWTYAPDAEGRIALNTGMSKEGKTCVEIQWFAPDAGGPVGIWREMKLPSNADRLRISMRKRGSCPRARLDLQVGMAGRPVRFYPVRLQDLSTGWVTKELDLETRTPQPGAALHQSEVEAVFAILSLEGRGDVLVDQLECRVVERR